MSAKASLLSRFFIVLLSFSPSLKKKVWKWWYDLLAKKDNAAELLLMNYGYVPSGEDQNLLDLESDREKYRYALQLYYFLTQGYELENKKILEIGSGRGGGGQFLCQQHDPLLYIGLDLSYHASAWAQQNLSAENLQFIQGQSDLLPFKKNSLDIIINVESSHCYPDFRKFLGECHRVLTSGGLILFCDFRPSNELDKLFQYFLDAGFVIENRVDITTNVVSALDLANDAHKSVITQKVPGFMQAALADFSGIQDTAIYSRLKDRTFEYTKAVLRKT
jgi:ubiquinone/menaquinone biosynthesis C-methylase UbiE